MKDSKNGFPAVPMRLILLFLSLMLAATAHAAPLRGKVTGIVVEKEKRIMTLFNGRKALKTYRIALGGNPEGHKEQEGDSRTPEGRYIIDAKIPKSSFHLSLKVSYPNRTDRQNARRRRRHRPGLFTVGTDDPGRVSVVAAERFIGRK
jgi:murein L,D-transpeptidase YafK